MPMLVANPFVSLMMFSCVPVGAIA